MNDILIVEDAPAFREPLAAALKLHGYDTRSAANGAEALAAMQVRRPDLLLLDIAMPGMDGLALLRTIRSIKRLENLPVILLTAMVKREYILQARTLGAKEYMLKSQFSLTELLSRIARYMAAPTQAPRPAAARAVALVDATTTTIAAPRVGADASHDEDNDDQPVARVTVATNTESPDNTTPTAEGTATSRGFAGDQESDPGQAATAPLPPRPVVEELPEGKTGMEALKTLRPLLTRSEINDHLDNCGELRALSPTVSQLIKMTASDQCSIERVVRAIKQDHAIALKVLKLANSTIYTRGDPVETVQKAVMRIGLTQIRHTVLNIGVMEAFGVMDLGDELDVVQCWEHSIGCGLIAAELARCIGGGDAESDAAFTMGLIHDVGRLAYADMLGETYASVLRTAHQLDLPGEVVESRLLLMNHADAMDRILHVWRFPKQLINPIVFHHLSMGNIRHMARTMVDEVAVLALADRLAHAMLIGASGNEMLYPTHEYCLGLKITGEKLNTAIADAPDNALDLKLVMLNRSGVHNTPDFPSQVRGRLARPVHPLFITTHHGIDGYGIFCDRLHSADSPEQPNLAVVHLAHPREREQLARELKAAEARFEVASLPMLLLSSKADPPLPQAMESGRHVLRQTTPVSVRRMIDLINELTAA